MIGNTSCWNCSATYPITIAECPQCRSANANVDWLKARKQMGIDQSGESAASGSQQGEANAIASTTSSGRESGVGRETGKAQGILHSNPDLCKPGQSGTGPAHFAGVSNGRVQQSVGREDRCVLTDPTPAPDDLVARLRMMRAKRGDKLWGEAAAAIVALRDDAEYDKSIINTLRERVAELERERRDLLATNVQLSPEWIERLSK